MLNLNLQIGKNPLEKHKPIYFKAYQQLNIPYCYTVGESGQIVAWKKYIQKLQQTQLLNSQIKNPLFQPVYYMIPSINGDHQKCVSLIICPLRLINQQERTYKIIAYHSDNRIRIWQSRDGSCTNISSHNLFEQKIIGLCQNPNIESRFIFAFSDNCIFVVDCWTMKVLDKYQPKKQVYSQFLKGRINQKKQLELYDNYHKSYKFDVSTLFKQSFIDVGRSINSLTKIQNQLKQVLYSLHDQKLVLVHKVWKTQDYKTPLSYIIQSQNFILNKQSLINHIFDANFITKFPQINQIMSQNINITIQNLFFVKGMYLWYFIGTQNGKIFGFPAIKQKNSQYYVVKDQSNFKLQTKNPVRYLNLVQNLLIASWQDGTFKVFTVDSMLYYVQQQMSKQKLPSTQQKTNICCCQLDKIVSFKQKFSSCIKYVLPIYILSGSHSSSSKQCSQQLGFQLQNNQIIIFDSLHNRASHYVGIQQKKKVYVVLYMSCGQYVGIGTQDGIQLFGFEGYQRRINYKDWQWKEWNLTNKYESKQDYNVFQENSSNGLQLIQFANRHTINQIQYTSDLSRLLEQTFGTISTQGFTNQLYSKFHFIDKIQAQKSLHSRAIQNFIAVLKHKHNSYRRDGSNNMSFILNSNLNKQLDMYSTSGSNKTLQQSIQSNFIFYSCFLWDQFQIPFLTKLIRQRQNQFVLKRRYVSQGIGKTFTIYFDLYESIFGLSKYLLTEYAISAISFMQCYVLKEIQKADQLVSVVQYFTLSQQRQSSIYISGEILSKSIISSNQNIVKACINLLISSIISGHIDIHPLYEYFVLNLKNIQQKKQQSSSAISHNSPIKQYSGNKMPILSANKQKQSNIISPNNSRQINIIPNYSNYKELNEIECEWMLYLGLGVIYGKCAVQKQQVKMLLNRIIQCIDLVNFVRKPDLVQIIMKLLNQGLANPWKQHLSKETAIKLYQDLFKIFFYYDGAGHIASDDKKFNFCFQSNSQQHIKRMKQTIIKTIVYLSKQFNNEFIQSLTTETVNQKPHSAYPSSVIEILRQYLKSQKPTSHLVFYVQLLLQCLSPMTPNLRKYVQKNVISTLQYMCTYRSISFNQSSQRLSIKSHNHLYIYCLRTSTKWRTISLVEKQSNKQQIQNVRDEDCILQMSPKGNYIALLTYRKLYIWRLSSGFWSGILGAFSQGWTFDLPKGKNTNIVWDQTQNSITVVNQDPSLNKAFNV